MKNDIEHCFNRALSFSFSKKKNLLVFFLLVFCGILIIFCRALSFEASDWVGMSLVFLPIFLSGGILLSLGTLLIRIYYHEVKKNLLSYRKIFRNSWELILSTSYLSILPVLLYLLLWMVLGLFLLLREIPVFGHLVATVLVFAPFLLILASILLVVFTLALLFFATPVIALRSKSRLLFVQNVFSRLKNNPFRNLVFFFLALFPAIFVIGILSFTALLTESNYLPLAHPLSVSLQWFFLMLPFCAFLTPAVIFFFNFAAEAYNLLSAKDQTMTNK